MLLSCLGEIESRTLAVGSDQKVMKFVSISRRCLQNAKPNDRGLVEPRYDQTCLVLRVSRESREPGVLGSVQ